MFQSADGVVTGSATPQGVDAETQSRNGAVEVQIPKTELPVTMAPSHDHNEQHSPPSILSQRLQKDSVEDIYIENHEWPVSSFPDNIHDNLGIDDLLVLDAASNENSDIAAVTDSPTRSVRFRSRVRITSGINPHRHNLGPYENRGPENELLYFSRQSSLSGSPSSSISAPLRSRADDEFSKPGWGTLGQRVSLFAKKSQRNKVSERRGSLLRKNSFDSETDVNEETPLSRRHFQRRYGTGGETSDAFTDPDRDDEIRLSREIDVIFGTWPGRLLNHHWWWWNIEPILCCQCTEEPDSDEG